MKIRIEGNLYEGSGTEIMESLRLRTLQPDQFPDTDSYIRSMQENFIRFTEMACPLPDSGVEERARAMFARLDEIGALEILDEK